jgi:acetylornithine deacetylase
MDRDIDAWIDAHADELIEAARALVRIPTENHPPTGDEAAGQRFVQARLAELGAEIDVFTPDEVPGLREHPAYFPLINGQERQATNRPDVVGTFRGSGGGRSVLFSTHIDTVPAGEAPWQVGTPFGGEVIDGKLYGRGSYDTKCALMSHVFAVRCLREIGVTLRGDVKIESVVDEEYGGSHGTLASRLRGHNADIAINSEPTHLVVCPAHRGGRDAYLRLQGDAGMIFHGEKQIDPVVALGHAIVAIKDFDRRRNREEAPPLYRDNATLPFYLNQVGGGGTTFAEAVGTLSETYLHFWAEVYEGTIAEEFDHALLAHVQQALDADPDCAGLRPKLVPAIRFLPGSSLPLDHPALAVLQETYESLGQEYRLQGASFACDGYIFNHYSPTPAVVLGPGGGKAHAPDEYVLTADLLQLAKICAHFMQRWCC